MFRALPGHCLHLLRLLAISISFQMKRFRLTRGCGLVSHVPDDGFLCYICTCRIVEAAEGGDRTSIAPNRLLAARRQQPNCGLTAVNHWEFEGRPGSIPFAPPPVILLPCSTSNSTPRGRVKSCPPCPQAYL
jgi:hypothetical protein